MNVLGVVLKMSNGTVKFQQGVSGMYIDERTLKVNVTVRE